MRKRLEKRSSSWYIRLQNDLMLSKLTPVPAASNASSIHGARQKQLPERFALKANVVPVFTLQIRSSSMRKVYERVSFTNSHRQLNEDDDAPRSRFVRIAGRPWNTLNGR